jgi:putative membrane protein
VIRFVSNPLLAVITANAILITINTPLVSDRMIGSPLGSFVLDIFWLVAGFVLWFPVQPPSPMKPRLVGPLALVYLIIQSVAPLPTAFFMTWAEYPLFATFELSPRIFSSFGPIDDQQMGAAVMQVIGGLIIWIQIAARFLNWSLEKQRRDAGPPTYVDDPDPDPVVPTHA